MKKTVVLLIIVFIMIPISAFCGGQAEKVEAEGPVTLIYSVDIGETDQLIAHTLADAYMEKNPDVIIEIENRPQGGDGDNIVKTRLATEDMTDLFFYNAGSLLQALNPSKNTG